MAIHPFNSLSLDDLKRKAAATNDRAQLTEIRDYVRDCRNTRAARAFERDLDNRLSLLGEDHPAGAAAQQAQPRTPPIAQQAELLLEPSGPPRRRRAPPQPAFDPTAEQVRARDAFMRGGSLKICAFAGAGKTSTLKLMANEREGAGLYLAFNSKIASDARGDFSREVDCRTTHSLAARSVQGQHGFARAKMFNRIGAMQLASVLELKNRKVDDVVTLTPAQQAFLFLATVRRFAQSADQAIGPEHVMTTPRLLGLRPDVRAAMSARVLDEATKLWARMTSATDEMPLGHDGYLKLWALGKPRLRYDYVLLDEAQDTNPVVLGVLIDQATQMVYVGDRHQQIYEWRGAVNAMDLIATDEMTSLTQSFRFGEAIARQANRVLRALGEDLPLQGNDRRQSRISDVGRPNAILARTNATVIAETLAAIEHGQRPFILGGTTELRRLVGDVFNLLRGEPGSHPDFFGFKNWDEVVAFAEGDEGESLAPFVNLVQMNGPGRLWAAITNSASEEAEADLSVSTAHKAKGAEWDSVQLANDFLADGQTPQDICEAEARLFYVAMTRAKELLIVEPGLLSAYCGQSRFAREAMPRGRSRGRARESAASPAHQPRQPSAPSQQHLDPSGDWPAGMF
ncbi:MAG: UvrD-helicase domain-containing protein [Hyphomonadaceae bacterium]|jgi:hypothetical protein|nr:UvrD-helicase domain-containing protein [Hyphomonadaceae bacterium]